MNQIRPGGEGVKSRPYGYVYFNKLCEAEEVSAKVRHNQSLVWGGGLNLGLTGQLTGNQ